MDSERARKRKRLFLCFACSITMSLAIHGCVHLLMNPEGERHLATARSLMSKGEFEASLRESREILRRYPKAYGDRALCQMGLVYLHPQNPNSDYQMSIEYFQRLAREFPGSSLRSEAEIWISLLQTISEKEKEIDALNRIRNLEEKELTEKKEDMKELQGQVEKLQNQAKALQSQTEDLEKALQSQTDDLERALQSQTDDLEKQIKDLKEQIKQMKEIDLGIEEKRRDTLRKREEE